MARAARISPPARSSAFARVTTLAGLRPVHEAFRWLHLNDQLMMGWQAELVGIPSPPFGEAARSRWMAERFLAAGLGPVRPASQDAAEPESSIIDAVGNVLAALPLSAPFASGGPIILLSAHLDTVFPAQTPLHPVVSADRIEAPGACDNAAGVIGMLALAHAMVVAEVHLPATLIFVGNVGEEGEGDLRGVRYLYEQQEFARRVVAHIVLDGAGDETAVTQALGSRRFQVNISGPGGHSFTDAGTPNPIAALAAALTELSRAALPAEPRTTLNVGTIAGGTSVNSIPELATAAVDIRSTSMDQIVRLEVALHRAVEDSVAVANRQVTGTRGLLRYAIEKIGDRPAAELPNESALMDNLRAVDRHLGLRTDPRLGSTDANWPLSLGVPAVSLGAGGEGGGAHTMAEWYSAANRELGLRRVLLLVLAMVEWAAGSQTPSGD